MYKRTEEEVLLGVTEHLEPMYDQKNREEYMSKSYTCKGCHKDITDFVDRPGLVFCPYCRRDLRKDK